jgi:hypothetical protein
MTYLNEEVNSIESSPSVRLPCAITLSRGRRESERAREGKRERERERDDLKVVHLSQLLLSEQGTLTEREDSVPLNSLKKLVPISCFFQLNFYLSCYITS